MKRDVDILCDDFCPTLQAGRIELQNPLELVELFKVFSDETRIKLVYLLGQGEACTCDLASSLELSPPAISHHLRLLRAMKLVVTRREGKMVYYRLRDEHILNIVKEAVAFLCDTQSKV